MRRRQWVAAFVALGIVAGMAAIVASLPASALGLTQVDLTQAQPGARLPPSALPDEAQNRAMAESCLDCARDCELAAHHCFVQLESGKKEYANALHLCVDCADVCVVSGRLCGRASALAPLMCDASSTSCDECVRVCESFTDAEMKRMVDSCRKASQSCRSIGHGPPVKLGSEEGQ